MNGASGNPLAAVAEAPHYRWGRRNHPAIEAPRLPVVQQEPAPLRLVTELGSSAGGNQVRCSIWDLNDASSFSFECEQLCLWLPISGALTVVHEDGVTQYPFSGSSIATIPPGSSWRGSWRGNLRCLLLEVGTSVLRECGKRNVEFPNQRVLTLVQDERIRLGLLALYQELLHPTPASELFIGHIARGVASRYLSTYCMIAPTSWDHQTLSPNDLRRVKGAILESLDKKPCVERLAAMVGLGPASFGRRFRNSAGMPLYQFVLHARIDRAKALITKRDTCIRELALGLGFYDHSQFTNTFRRIVGVSPREYLQRGGE